ncbi:MAG: alpha/beta hydrolase [Pseudomonadota bacterium]
MYIDVNGHKTYCYTGGKTFDATKPTVVFIHGVLNDHSVWILQTRYFAHHGWNVLAPDLPGQSRSAGDSPSSVEEGAAFVETLLDAAGVKKAALVGHSFGSLIALELAGSAPERVSQLVMVGTAYPMKVTPALQEMSLNQPLKAIDMVNVFSHSTLAPPPSALGPGTWLYGGSSALMKRVLRSNTSVNIFHRGFKACNDYAGGDAAMENLECEVMFLLGRSDQMTSPKQVAPLAAKAKHGKTVLVQAGHQLMTEAPDEVLDAMKNFLKPA